MNISKKKILITGAITGFGNITAKLPAENGKCPLRTAVDKMMSGTTEIINETSSKVQAGLLQNFGLSELNINNPEILN